MDYKILSFILLLKSHQSNSLIYKGLSFGAFLRWSNMKIDRKTFGRYMGELSERGLLTSQGGHTEIVSWRKCFEVLDINLKAKQFKNIIGSLRNKSFAEAISLVREEVIFSKLMAQKYYVDKNKRQLDSFKSGKIKGVQASARKVGKSIEQYVSCIEKKLQVVTGSRHLQNTTGMSRQTANKALNRLSKVGRLHRHVVKKVSFTDNVNHATYDVVASSTKNFFFVSQKHRAFIEILGSVISFS